MKKPTRFVLRTPAGDEPQAKAETPSAVLSKAITRASKATEPGVWEVVEYEDTLYRVTRKDSDKKLDVIVEVMR